MMKRVLIVIVAGLGFGVSAAYATTSHTGSTPPQSSQTGTAPAFAVSGGAPTSTNPTTTGSDDPATHDQGDDNGQDQQPATEAGEDRSGQDATSADDSQDDNSQGDEAQPHDDHGDDSQSGGSGSRSGDDSGSDAGDD
jgi:hypothetical protein